MVTNTATTLFTGINLEYSFALAFILHVSTENQIKSIELVVNMSVLYLKRKFINKHILPIGLICAIVFISLFGIIGSLYTNLIAFAGLVSATHNLDSGASFSARVKILSGFMMELGSRAFFMRRIKFTYSFLHTQWHHYLAENSGGTFRLLSFLRVSQSVIHRRG